MKYFEDYEPGQEIAYSGRHEITEQEIVEIGRRWDPQPFHTDRTSARESIFGGLVASSVHLFAIAVKLGNQGDGTPTAAVSALGFEDVRVLSPARPGDVLTIRGRCVEARPSRSRPECGIMKTCCELINQSGEPVFTFTTAALIRRRADAAKTPSGNQD